MTDLGTIKSTGHLPGHYYSLANFEDDSKVQTIQFIEKRVSPEDPTKFITAFDGTTLEEVLRMLIDRLGVMHSKFPCEENACATQHLKDALAQLELRTARRKARNVEGKPLA